ncbi:MAG: glycine-rich domain-containing protein, partial [bacterium]
TGTVGSNGLILGHADFAGTEGDWCGFQLAIYTLGSNNLLPSATALSITAGATFDVSAITNYTLGASASLTANGTGTAVGTDAAVIQGNSSGTVDLGSRPVTLAFTPAAFSGDTTHPALVVPQGALTLNGAVTVNINGSTPLGAGTYWLISQASGSISGTPTLAATTGPGSNNGLVSGASAVLQRTGGQINLLVSMSMISPSVTLTRHEGTGDTTTYGDALSFDVTVTPITPNTPTGDVTLKDGGTILGTYTLAAPDSGACVIAPALNALKAGSHTNIVAVYAGDINFNSGDSAALSTQTVSNKVLTIPDAQAHNKFYDGTTNATLTGTISGTVSGDSVTLTLSGHFADAAAGLGKAVTSTSTLDAPSQANYTLAQPAGLTADILPAAVWTNPAAGSWAASGNWQSGLVGSGANLAAAFRTLTLGGAGTVALNGARIIGNLLFGDQGNAHGWTLGTGSNGPLTLAVSSGSPTVNVTNQTLEISAVLTGSQGLTKTGAGTLILSATNTYSGATAVSGGTLLVNGALASGSAVTVAGGGTLTGAGTINGAVTIGSGGTLQPGTAGGLGTLTVNNTLTLLAGSTNVMRLNKAGAVLTNARVTGMTGVTYGGTLQVSATGDALAAGDTFILFTTASGEYSGSFTTLNLPALAGGLVWDTYSLAFNGSIVVSVSDKPGNTGTGGVVTYTDSNGSNSVSYPPYKNGYVVHAFVATGANTLSLPTSVSSADVLVVAGGGGGGWVVGGGGGAGGLLYQTGHTISSGSNTVTVGAGGLGAVAHANPNFEPPTSGGISSFGTLTAVGGGYGAYSDWVAHFPAAAGGSGGGGFLTAWSGADRLVAGAGTSGQGNAGADGSEGIYSGGGGGAGAPGSARNGGNGLDYSFLCGTGYGVSGWFAGGGGSGATVSSGLAGAGGTGGGGAGAAVSGAGASGVAHTGGGGGGGDQLNSTCGNGGSGIVIVRYPYELPRGTLIMLF